VLSETFTDVNGDEQRALSRSGLALPVDQPVDPDITGCSKSHQVPHLRGGLKSKER
jgi:hypothetical protein